MNCILGCSLLLLLYVFRTTLGQTATGYDCCGVFLMDTSGRVAIETRRQLVPGSYVALRVRACATEPVSVQIWRRVNDVTLTFRWQTVIRPVLSQTMRTFVTVVFNSSLDITVDDRLGVYSPANMSHLAIPFGSDPSVDYLYHSSTAFDAFSSFSSSIQVTTDDLRWPRSFNGSVIFCRQTGCADIISDVTPGSSTTTQPYTGVTPSDQCCPNPVVCDSSGLAGPISNQSDAIQKLNQKVNDITEIIVNLLSNRQVTGICPQGYAAGSYGVGKCYLVMRDYVPMAVAALRCQTDFNAILVQIRNIIEDSYLRTLLSSDAASGMQSFWTAGMYNPGVANWYWYDESSRTKATMSYTNWLNNIRPTPLTDEDICMKLVVTQGVTNSSYWQKSDCHDNNYYVCQVQKQCL